MSHSAPSAFAGTASVPPPVPRYELEAAVVAHRHIVASEYEIVFAAPDVAQAAQPGQFLELLYNECYVPLVRRPFSIYGVDRAVGTCSVHYQARGAFTSGLAAKQPGDRVSLLGPLGRPYRWTSAADTRHILIAGGIGAPPLVFLAGELCRARGGDCSPTDDIIVLNGARTRDLLVGMVEFGDMDVTLHALTDDGSHGRAGKVTELLLGLLAQETDGPTHLYACGPMPMLRAVGEIALARSIPCQLSIETSMPCGLGVCNGCAIPVRDPAAPNGTRFALGCCEGPVFEASELLWQ
jgi:dihydroorotate dehydrogenase electron transfer subunit